MFSRRSKDQTPKVPLPASPADLVVKDLLVKHAATIAELKRLCAAELAPQEAPDFKETCPGGYVFDDLALCRYALSFRKVTAAAKALKASIEFRSQAAYLADASAPHADVLKTVGDFHGTMKGGEPLFFVRDGHMDIAGMLNSVTNEQMMENWMWWKEQLFIKCDKATREQGRIVKAVIVEDMKGYSLNLDRRLFKIAGEISKLSEVVYPGVLGIQVIVNAPTYMKMMFRIAKVFISQKTMSKVRPCPGLSKGTSAAQCPFASHYIDPETIPSFVGGACKCGSTAEGACICGLPNNLFHYKQMQAVAAGASVDAVAMEIATDADVDDTRVAEALSRIELAEPDCPLDAPDQAQDEAQ